MAAIPPDETGSGDRMPTVFYSWQDDLDPKTNRSFLGDVIGDAIEEFNRDRAPDQQLVLDMDARGEPGHVDIADAIFAKIEACFAFIGDVTFVATDTKRRGIPNPNVAIEYGYARSAIGAERLICVSNDAHGKWARETAPFHFVARRFPIAYELASDADKFTRRNARVALRKDVVGALNAIDKTFRKPAAEFAPAAAKWGQGSFIGPREVLEVVSRGASKARPFDLHKGARGFLRLHPKFALPTKERIGTPKDLLQQMLDDRIGPLGYQDLIGKLSAGTVSDGAVILASTYRSGTDLIEQLTKAFETGEIWGTDCHWPNRNFGAEDDQDHAKQIPIDIAFSHYLASLVQYRALMHRLLPNTYPWRLVVGFEGIKNHRVTWLSDVGHPILKEEVVHETLIAGPDDDGEKVLRPLFENLAVAAGLR